jgi:hypothetical protein
LIGYAINYQGYYGYGDLHYERVIRNLEAFINDTNEGIELNKIGEDILNGKKSAFTMVENNIIYGGVKRSDFHFDQKQNKLIKT